MKKKLLNNFSLKLLSFLLAFFLWLLVVNMSNPLIENSKEVELEVLNGDILESAGLTYEIVGKSTVTVKYTVATLDAYKIQDTDFRAYIDLADLYDVTGAVPVNLEVVGNQSMISSAQVKPEVVHVNTEELQRKRFDLSIVTEGEPEEGYALGTVTLDPEYLYINGPVSQVGQISSVGVEIQVNGANANINGTAEPVFYDANGNRLSVSSQITYDVEEIGYEVEILKVKTLPLDFQVTGTVADGYRYAGLTSDVQSISVVGLKSTLSNLNTITVSDPQLSVQGATQSRTAVIDLTEFIPENVSIVGGQTEATVVMDVERLSTRVFTLHLEDIKQTGASSRYTYSFAPDEVEVTVEGLKDDLDAMAEEDLNAQLDLSGLTPGTAQGVLKFEVDDGLTVENYTQFQVTVSQESQTEEETVPDGSSYEQEEAGEDSGQVSSNTDNE